MVLQELDGHRTAQVPVLGSNHFALTTLLDVVDPLIIPGAKRLRLGGLGRSAWPELVVECLEARDAFGEFVAQCLWTIRTEVLWRQIFALFPGTLPPLQ
jgi:hypothetical protein